MATARRRCARITTAPPSCSASSGSSRVGLPANSTSACGSRSRIARGSLSRPPAVTARAGWTRPNRLVATGPSRNDFGTLPALECPQNARKSSPSPAANRRVRHTRSLVGGRPTHRSRAAVPPQPRRSGGVPCWLQAEATMPRQSMKQQDERRRAMQTETIAATRHLVCDLVQRAVLAPLVRRYFRLTVRSTADLAALPTPCILAANHSSHLDSLAILAALPEAV